MDDARTGKMTPGKTLHPIPRPTTATSLTAAAEHVEPKTSDLVYKTANAVTVARDGVIIQPALHNTPQPTGRFAKWPVHSLTQFSFDRLECGTHAFGHRMSMDREPTLLASLGTLVREAKKVESFRPTLAASFTPFACIATEFDQTRFPFVQLQAKLDKPRAEFFQTRRCLVMMLEADHKVIRITYDHHIAAAAVFPPPLDPQVKHIV